jgi:transcription initiation factor TFIIB
MLTERMVAVQRKFAVCKECRGELLFDPDSSEQICAGCGIVSEPSYVPYYPSSLNHEINEEPESKMVYDLHLHTLIGNDNTDANGRHIRLSSEFDQLRRLNSSTISRDSKISNEMKALNEINQITQSLGLSTLVAKEAQDVYHKGLNDGVIRGKSIANMAAACILIASKTIGASCNSEDIERIAPNVNGRMSRRYYRLLIRQMNLKVATVNPASYLSGIAGKAGLSVRVERKALAILSAVESYPTLVDKRSISLAVAALYLASISLGERTNQLRLAFAAGITPITIRKRSVEISRVLEELRTGGTSQA